MVSITADEKKRVLAAFPNVHIVRTMKQRSKRHHYYMAEDVGPLQYLNSLRAEAPMGERRGM